MSLPTSGAQAETAACEYLVRQGFEVVERNFKTPRCEIDIIARKRACLYFVEVKYRSRANQGNGLDYITSQKLRQMHYAAETWLQNRQWRGETTLAAIEVAADFEVTEFIESIS